MRNALSSIKRHVDVQPSALAKAISVTCEYALTHIHDEESLTGTDPPWREM